MFFIYLLSLTIFTILLNYYLLKKQYLISETGDNHQKFASKTQIPLTGGIYIFFSFLYLCDTTEINLIVFLIAILLLGVISDLKLIKSAKKRLFFQISIVLIFIILSDIQINNTRVNLLDNILIYPYINYFFVCFCVLIVINGSNFLDGLNTLNIGYYLIISSLVTYLYLTNQIVLNENFFQNLIYILGLLYIFNFFNKIFLGDSGSYLLGSIFSILLINLYSDNVQISPFFIILLLWYPSYETLFSMIRKNILKRSPMKPDSNHLHQLIYFYLKNKFSKRVLFSNLITANFINCYNLLVFFVASNFIVNTQIQIIFIILNLIVYTVIYFKLFIYRYKKL